jgi:hypothetical protein
VPDSHIRINGISANNPADVLRFMTYIAEGVDY